MPSTSFEFLFRKKEVMIQSDIHTHSVNFRRHQIYLLKIDSNGKKLTQHQLVTRHIRHIYF